MYAPPAVALPKTSATVGIPAADILVRSRNIAPPGMKMSFWVFRSAPPDSISPITGSRFSAAMSIARSRLRWVHGLLAPPAHGRVGGDQHALHPGHHPRYR